MTMLTPQYLIHEVLNVFVRKRLPRFYYLMKVGCKKHNHVKWMAQYVNDELPTFHGLQEDVKCQ